MKQIRLDDCIHQRTEQISDPPRSLPKPILRNESMWPVNYSPYVQQQILPPNPLCAFMTQHMWSLQMEHKDGGYSSLLLNAEIEWYRELTLYSGSVLPIILEHGINFNSYIFGLFPSYVLTYNTIRFTNTFSPCLQACFSQNKYRHVIIYTVIKRGLKSIYWIPYIPKLV